MAEPAKNFDTDDQEKPVTDTRSNKNDKINTNLRLHKIEGGGQGSGIPQGRLSSVKNRSQNPRVGKVGRSSANGGTIYDRRSNSNSLHSVPNENVKGSGKSGASGSKGSNWNKQLSPEEVNAAESSAGGFADSDRRSNSNSLHSVPNENVKGSGKSGASGSKGSNWNKQLSPEEVNAAESSAGGFADSDKAPRRNGLRLVPSGKTEETEAPGSSNAKGSTDVTSEADSNSNDKKSESGADSSGADRVGKGFSAAAMAGGEVAMARQALKLVAKIVGKHKKGFLAGGGIIGIIVAAILLVFSFVLSHELLTIEADLLREFTKIEQHFEKEVSNSIASDLACQAMPDSCPNAKNSKDPADEPKSGGDTEPLGDDMNNFSFNDPTISDALGNQGITVGTDAAGNVTLTNEATGEAITADDIANDSELADRFQTALPEWDVGQLTDFVKTAEDNADATFAGAPDSDDSKTTEQAIKEDMSEGESGTDAADATVTNNNPEGEGTVDDTGPLSKVTDAVGTALTDGDTATAATKAGVQALEPEAEEGVAEFDIAALATVGCNLEKTVHAASVDRIPTIISLLIRHGATLLSLADQLKSGHITGSAVNTTMQMLNGNPDATVSSAQKGTANDDSLPFSASATWQEAIGNPNASASPSILASAMPTANAGQLVVNDLTTFMNDTGMSFACSALTSPFSVFIQFGVGAVELLTNLGDFGGTEVGQAALTTGLTLTLQDVILPEVVQYFTPVGLSGAENSVQLMNNSGAGINLASNDYARSLGGEPLSDSDADSIAMEATQEDQIAEANLPWTQRIFSPNDPNSLVSNIALDMPVSLGQLISKIGSYFTRLPSTLMRAVGSIFSGHIALALTADTNPGTLYSVTQYGFTDSELKAQQDPIANEEYLYNNVAVPAQLCGPVTTTTTTIVKGVVKKKTVTTTVCVPTTYSVQRIAALGNPKNATIQPDAPNGSGSPVIGNSIEVNTTEPQWVNSNGGGTNADLLHCYDDGFTTLQENLDGGADTNCGGLGSYDDTNTNASTNGANDPYSNLPSDNIVIPEVGHVSTAGEIYCNVQPPPPPPNKTWLLYSDQACANMMYTDGQTTNNVNDFRQYLLDLNIMTNYDGLTN